MTGEILPHPVQPKGDMKLQNPNAFKPFYRHLVVATANRNGVKSQKAIRVVFVVAQAVQEGGAPVARQLADNYTVVVENKLDWVSEDGPKYGDTIEHQDYGVLTVQHVQPKAKGWQIIVSGQTFARR